MIEAFGDVLASDRSAGYATEMGKGAMEAAYPRISIEAMSEEIGPEAEGKIGNKMRSVDRRLYPPQALAGLVDCSRRLRVNAKKLLFVVPCRPEDRCEFAMTCVAEGDFHGLERKIKRGTDGAVPFIQSDGAGTVAADGRDISCEAVGGEGGL